MGALTLPLRPLGGLRDRLEARRGGLRGLEGALTLLAEDSGPWVCHCCWEPFAEGAVVIWSERHQGPVDVNCHEIPAVYRFDSAVRRVWLATTSDHRAPEAPAYDPEEIRHVL